MGRGWSQTSNTDYRLQHTTTDSGGLLWDISAASNPDDWGDSGPGSYMPRDVYEHPEWYFNMSDPTVRNAFNVVKSLRGADPDSYITIYRGSPRGVLNDGDWVSLTRDYADVYSGDGPYSDNPNSKTYEYRVRVREIVWQGDDIREFGYFGNRKRPRR